MTAAFERLLAAAEEIEGVPCFACRHYLPWPCRCNHDHRYEAPPGSVAGRKAIVFTCSVCGHQVTDD